MLEYRRSWWAKVGGAARRLAASDLGNALAEDLSREGFLVHNQRGEMNKANFLSMLRSKRARLMQNLDSLDHTMLINRPTADSWSIKDSLAHLTFYEQHMLNNVRQTLDKGAYISGPTLQEQTERNAHIFDSNKDRSLAEITADMRTSFAQVIALVEEIPETILIDPNHFGWLNEMPLWQYILDETAGEHYEEHLGSLMEGV